MLRKILNKTFFKYVFILIISYSLAKVGYRNNYFIFSIPWILFCFLNNKWYGYASFMISFLILGLYNRWFYLSSILIISTILFLKRYLKNNNKLEIVISLLSFFLTFIESILVELIYNSNNYIYAFIFGIISYWLMRYFYSTYITLHVSEDKSLKFKVTTFILFILGVSFLGLDLVFWKIDISLIGILLIAFIASNISLETGVLYTFLMLIMMNNSNYEIILFFSASIINFILNKTSKITLISVYIVGVFAILYYYDLSYYLSINYCVSVISYCLIPRQFLNEISKVCLGSEKYIESIKSENKKKNIEIANKIIKMEEIFSLVSSKLNMKGRLKKYEKELLVEEINVFDNLLKEFASDIRCNYGEYDYYSKVEKEIYKYGFDLLWFDVNKDIFGNKLIRLNIRCEEKEIKSIIIPLVSKVLRQKYVLDKVNNNDLFNFYEITLKEDNKFNLSFGVGQKAKDGEVCGDSYLVYENSEKKIFALSDGMGTGKEAKEKSKLALDLFKKFMDVGFEEKQAVSSINCILKSKYAKDSYATLDLLIYDKYTNEFYFSKNGACNSYIINEEVKSVDGDDLPIGIIDKIDFKEQKLDIKINDYIVMTSDGISDKKISLLKKIKNKDPQKMVREILESNNEIYDDETIMVVKIKK